MALGWCALPASAHKASDSYLTLRSEGALVQGRIDVALRDLDFVLGLDANGDGDITWGELNARSAAIARYVLSRLDVRRGGRDCRASSGELMIDSHSDGAYAVLPLRFDCAADGPLQLSYRLLFDIDPGHRCMANLTHDNASMALLFSPAAPSHTLGAAGAGPARLSTFSDYLAAGVQHILSGADHLLFLVSLLLAAVAPRAASAPSPAAGAGRAAFIDLCKMITGFSIAHSITLGLGFFDVVHLPSRWVESGIALSIVVAALNNVLRLLPVCDWVMAFAFGLVHGLGFANSLADLALSTGARLVALAAFNLGVELGQLSVVAPLFLLAMLIRGSSAYRRLVVPGLSGAIALAGVVWLLERAFDIGIGVLPG
ncbi:hypothetical protein DUGA2_43650 [Duganella sp. HH101]|nr:hypothetical protein DUGA2_43650 [Duganella sp. HH101]